MFPDNYFKRFFLKYLEQVRFYIENMQHYVNDEKSFKNFYFFYF